MRKKIEAFETWTWRKMLKISWRDKVPNEQVLKRVNEARTILHTIQERKRNWMGHVLRHEGLLVTILEGRMEGKGPKDARGSKCWTTLWIKRHMHR